MQHTAIFNCCKNDNFQMKNFHFCFAQYMDCVYTLEPPERGGSIEYPQSMLKSKKIKKNNVYPCKPRFYYIKEGCECV